METVEKNRDDYGIPLKILSYKDIYGWTMDAIVEQVRHTFIICNTLSIIYEDINESVK